MNTTTETLKVGPGLLDPAGRFHPCRYTEHSDTGRRLFHEQHETEAQHILKTQKWLDGLRELCQRGWVRIGENGAVTDDMWHRKTADDLTQAQLDVLADLLELGRAKLAEVRAEGSSGYLWEGYVDGLECCLLAPVKQEQEEDEG